MSDSKADELIRAIHSLHFMSFALCVAISIAMFVISTSINSLLAKFPSPVSVASMECVAMSQDHPGKALIDYLFSIPKYRDGQFLDINALDPLDPVHYRASKNPEREFDYDGDMGREHSEYLRDNGIGGKQSSVGTLIPIAAALPVIEAPSIVAEHPASKPVKTESE